MHVVFGAQGKTQSFIDALSVFHPNVSSNRTLKPYAWFLSETGVLDYQKHAARVQEVEHETESHAERLMSSPIVIINGVAPLPTSILYLAFYCAFIVCCLSQLL